MEKEIHLQEILRSKGIGPKGSKSISIEDAKALEAYFFDDSLSLVTKSTLLTALLLLEPLPHEKGLIEFLRNEQDKLPERLKFYFKGGNHPIEDIVLKLIDKVELNDKELEIVVDFIFEGKEDYLKAAILEGERLKRETFNENLSFFKGFLSRVDARKMNFDQPLILLSDSFDGWLRNNIYTAFVLPVLAELGCQVYTTGMHQVAPKFGNTTCQVLKKLGFDVEMSTDKACHFLKEKGWTFFHQKTYFPELFNLKQMRKEMVKRPFLATFEKFIPPVLDQNGQINIVAAYTHSHYKMEVVNLMKEFSFVNKFIHLKGTEATTLPKLNGEMDVVSINNQQIEESSFINDFTVAKEVVDVDEVVNQGLLAIQGVENDAFTKITVHAAFVYSHIVGGSFNDALELSREVLRKKSVDKSTFYV